jgi:hypothetical protein
MMFRPKLTKPSILDVELDDVKKRPVSTMPAPANSLEYLQQVYRGEREPDGAMMRAAIAALPFEHPKLAVTLQATEGSFAKRMELAWERSHRARLAPKVIEATPVVEAEPKANPAERINRRI